MFSEYQIRNALIIDGSGSPAKAGCLDFTNGLITAVGCMEHPAKKIIDAKGMIIAPGFIDVHTHADVYVDDFESAKSFIYQGVTTCVTGNCGFSAFPIRNNAGLEYLKYSAPIIGMGRYSGGYRSFNEYVKNNKSVFINALMLTGHGALKSNEESSVDNEKERIYKLCRILEEQLLEGSAGLSLGLIYYPGTLTKSEEFTELAKVVSKYGKVISVHLRDEGLQICKSIKEMLDIARTTGVHIHFSHHKLMGKMSWGLSGKTLAMLDDAEKEGLNVSIDAYPYTSGASTALVLLPPWVVADGIEKALERLSDKRILKKIQRDLKENPDGWENLSLTCGWDRIIIAMSGSHDENIAGRSIADIAIEKSCSEVEALADLLIRERGKLCIAINGMCQEDVDAIVTFHKTLIGSDGLFGEGAVHPRKYGAFSKFIKNYVFEKRMLTLEEAVFKITGNAAETFGIKDRGLLKPGYAADIVVFDPKKIKDKSNYEKPDAVAEGMEYVFLNGQIVLAEGVFFHNRFGSILQI